MNTYKISLGGRGSECFLFPLSDDQYVTLEKGEVENEKMELDEIITVLNVEDIFDAPQSILGAYLDEYYISVCDSKDQEVWNSENGDIESDDKWCVTDYDGQNYLVIEDYSKGNFFNFYVDLEEDFDPSKLSLVITEVGQCRDIITSIQYNGLDLDDTKEFDDYWSKGFYFILSKKYS
jgi:hypothetical protein